MSAYPEGAVKCQSCGAPVHWLVYHKDGRRKVHPVDPPFVLVLPGAEPSEFCPRVQGIGSGGRYVAGVEVFEGTPGAEWIQVSHFATCPDAARWRKR